ncbi:MAG: transposase, partial [Cetobacterium sp.]
FSFIRDRVKHLYSDRGINSIDPVVLFKIIFIQYIFGIRSMRQTIKEIQVNIAYRWFLGFDIRDKVPHFSTFSKNYERRFKGTPIFEEIFYEIIHEISKCNFLNLESVFIDGTHVKASANNKRFKSSIVFNDGSKFYQDELN